MAHGWVKSLQCKSRAFDDVYDPTNQKPKRPLPAAATATCRSGAQTLKDVIGTAKQRNSKSKPPEKPVSKSRRHDGAEPSPAGHSGRRHRAAENGFSATLPVRTSGHLFPALTELPEGHPSRNVVDIIFHTSWNPKAFSGRVEMMFKVQNGPRTVARFEEYREEVKSRAGPDDVPPREENARCNADGNEVMRFQCVGPTSASFGPSDVIGGTWARPRAKGAVICTFSGSKWAHESAGGGRGRRAMMVCRVIAGRVGPAKQIGLDPFGEAGLGYDSVGGENGELLVFDPRAVLPCFLIIYRL